MPDLVIGRRDSSDDDWHWYPVPVGGEPDGDGPRRSRSGLLLAAIGAFLTGVGLVLLVLSLDNDSSSGSQASPTALPASAGPATTATGSTAAASPTPARLLAPASPGDLRLFIWSRQQRQWLSSDLIREEPGYHEGDVVPFMLRVEHTTPSTLYEVQLTYVCRTTDSAAFDYLATTSDADGAVAALDPLPINIPIIDDFIVNPNRTVNLLLSNPQPAGGPALGNQTAAVLTIINDDSAISFDASGRRFRAWSASFRQAPEGPLPDGACQTEKRLNLSLMSQGGTMFMVWGGHLASKADWGENQGASSQHSPIFIEVTVGQAASQKLGIGPDAIAP